MSGTFYVVSDHAEDLADGRMVAPGAIVKDVDANDKHNKRLIDDGVLLPYKEPDEKQPSRDELLERAEELDISGRHNMNVVQLQSAIDSAEDDEEEVTDE